jgi:hypothetical protein
LIGWQQDREEEVRFPVDGGRDVQPCLFGLLPDVKPEPDAKDGLDGHQTDDAQVQVA